MEHKHRRRGMTRQEIEDQIRSKRSFLCVGLDADTKRIPSHFFDFDDPIFAFNKAVIDATLQYAVAYKPNLAFYEALGEKGMQSLKKTMDYLPQNVFKIADAKRGDIGNTASLYAKAVFEEFNFDAVTVAPYMGHDSVLPFLDYANKWVILLGLTSNPGANDFQLIKTEKGNYFFEEVMQKASSWIDNERLMFVVGATRGDFIAKARAAAPNSFFLVPGIGAQGGSLKDVVEGARIEGTGLLVNSSRQIIYAGNEPHDFSSKVTSQAQIVKMEMEQYI